MSRNGQLIIDVDAHYYENPRAFAQYLDEPWRTRFTQWTGRDYLTARTQSVDPRVGGRVRRDGTDRPTSREAMVHIMEYLETDVSVLLPGAMLAAGELTDKARAVALANGYIDHMLDTVVDPEKGIYTLIIAPNQSPPDAARLIDRAADHPGVCGVTMVSSGPLLPLGDSYYDPIYDACCRHDLPFVLHGATGGPGGNESPFGTQSYAENHCLGFLLNNQIQLASMVFQGVPERFPKLKIVYQEAGLLWIPLMMYRMDTTYSMLRSQLTVLKRPPSEYMKCFYYGTQPIERMPDTRYLQSVFETINGPDCLMFATDWPHRDFDSPVVIERLSFLDRAARAKIFSGNALKVLRFQPVGPLADYTQPREMVHGD